MNFSQKLPPDLEELISGGRKKANGSGGESLQLNSSRASAYQLSAIQWLWPNRFAIGKLGLIAGLPDEGKGQVISDMAARVTRGLEWPCGEGVALQGHVALLSAEDDPQDTVVPRLKAAGADLDKIEIVNMVRDDKKERMFSLVSDLPLLRQKIERTRRCPSGSYRSNIGLSRSRQDRQLPDCRCQGSAGTSRCYGGRD